LRGKNVNKIGVNYFNVRVTTFTQFGLDRMGQQEVLRDLLQYGVFKPQDRAKILKWLDMGYFEDEIDEFKRDRSIAYRENLLMIQGQPQMPLPEQAHAVHIEEHKSYMNTEEFKGAQPPVQQMFRQHLLLTELFMVKDAIKPQTLLPAAQLLLVQEVQQQTGIPLGALLNAGRTDRGNGTSQGTSQGSSGNQPG